MPLADGKWPDHLERFFNDFKTREHAPPNDGMVAPTFTAPDWIEAVARIPGSVEVAQRARETAEDGVKIAEDKAARLSQVLLALLTVTLALGSYQVNFALPRSWPWLFTVMPIGVALVCLAVATFGSLQVDRVGFYSRPDGSELANADTDSSDDVLLEAEVRGREYASWSARHKTNDLAQARAWFTRGLAALLVAGLVAGIGRASVNSVPPASPATTTTAAQPPDRLSSLGSPVRLMPGASRATQAR